jgi:hypothetical protein
MRQLAAALVGVLGNALFFVSAVAWRGTDLDGHPVEIENRELVRPGRDIDVFDHATRSHRNYSVESIRRSSGSIEIEVFDNETGDYNTLEMDDEGETTQAA